MSKGLPRSLSRGAPQRQEIIKRSIDLTGKTLTVSATGVAIGFGSIVIEGLPEGNVMLLGAVARVGLAGSGADANLTDTWSGDYGIGTTPANDATITGTDVNVIGSTAVGPAVAEVAAAVRAVNATPVIFDNTAADLELNLNVLIDAANIGDDQSVELTVSGSLEIAYMILGDD